jgi:MarR family transcriptional regulator, negative regulator of the multidrug operon emrRAB
MHDRLEHDRNVIAAFAVAVSDALRLALEDTIGQGGAAAGALLTIGAYPGRSIEQLRAPVDLSQPGAVRLVERLEREGWVERRPTPGRASALHLTARGDAAVARMLAARDAAITALLDPLEPEQLAGVADAAATALAARTTGRPELERLCRLCHRDVCVECPVSEALRERSLKRPGAA